MSDRMGVTEAQTYLAAWSTGDSVDMWKTRAARTIVAQAEQIADLERDLDDHHHDLTRVMAERNQKAEQIERLQNALTEAEVIFWESTGHDLEQQLERKGVKLNHDDLEAAK